MFLHAKGESIKYFILFKVLIHNSLVTTSNEVECVQALLLETFSTMERNFRIGLKKWGTFKLLKTNIFVCLTYFIYRVFY